MHVEVTANNIAHLTLHDLQKRYDYLQRLISHPKSNFHPDVLFKYVEEKNLIEKDLQDKGKANLLITQQQKIPGLEPRKETYRDLVVKVLKDHAREIKQLYSFELQLKNGVKLIFPSVTPSYKDSLGASSSGINSKTEKAILQQEKRIEILQGAIEELKETTATMDAIIANTLDFQEKQYIEKQYFSSEKIYLIEIADELNVSRTKLHYIRNSAYAKLAEALGFM